MKYTSDDFPALLSDVDDIYAGKGEKSVHFDLRKEKPAEDDLKKALLGRTGTLRAPAMKVGKTLIVGFNEDMYREIFG